MRQGFAPDCVATRRASSRRVRNRSSTWSSASRVGWPGSSMRCSVSTECGAICGVGVGALVVELDGDERVAELLAQELEAFGRDESSRR